MFSAGKNEMSGIVWNTFSQSLHEIRNNFCPKMKCRGLSETRFPKFWGRSEPCLRGKRPFKVSGRVASPPLATHSPTHAGVTRVTPFYKKSISNWYKGLIKISKVRSVSYDSLLAYQIQYRLVCETKCRRLSTPICILNHTVIKC